MPKIKWSAFPNVGTNITGDTVVGLRAGSNVEFDPVTPKQLQNNSYTFAVDSGVANAYVANLTPAVTSLTNGLQLLVKILNANTTTSTLTVNGHTAGIVTSDNKSLAGGELIANQVALFLYDATWNKFILVNSAYFGSQTNTITASGGTTVLTASSAETQIINGATFQKIQMPNTSTLALGQKFIIINNSTSTTPGFAINDSTGAFMMDCFPGVQYVCTCTSTSDTTFTGWDIAVNIFSIQKLQAYGNYQQTMSPSDVQYLNYTQSVFLQNIAVPINGVYYNNILNVSIDQTAPPSQTVVNAGNAQATGTFPFAFGAGLTTLIGNELLTNSNLNLQTATLTTVTLPKYIWNQGNINLGNCNFTVLNFAELLWATVITFNSTTFTSFSMPKCQGMRSNLTFTSATALTTFSAPLCVLVGGSITGTANVLTTFTFTALKYIWGNFTLTAAALTTLSLPSLVSMYGTWGTTMALCTTVDLSLLQNVTGAVTASFAALTTLDLPAIVSFGAAVTFTAANMTTFSMGATLKSVGGNWTMTGMKLNQASVDGILVSLAALDGTNGTTAYSNKTVNLSGGTSSAPSATGLAAKATLVARGCTVTTN